MAALVRVVHKEHVPRFLAMVAPPFEAVAFRGRAEPVRAVKRVRLEFQHL